MNIVGILVLIAMVCLAVRSYRQIIPDSSGGDNSDDEKTENDESEDEQESMNKSNARPMLISGKINHGITDLSTGWKEGFKRGKEEYLNEHPEVREQMKKNEEAREKQKKRK